MDDFLDEIIAESEKRNPGFLSLVDDAYRRRTSGRQELTGAAARGTTWMIVRVELLSGRGQDFDPPPGRDFLVSSQHTFRGFADAINSTFGRWELGHLHVFRVGDREIGTKVEDLDVKDDRRTKFGQRAKDQVFTFEFDFGDAWEHRCTVIDTDIDPDEAYGQRPRQPIPVFGWGTFPDQHGRSTPQE